MSEFDDEGRGPQEVAYDELISPLVDQIVDICQEHTIPFLLSMIVGGKPRQIEQVFDAQTEAERVDARRAATNDPNPSLAEEIMSVWRRDAVRAARSYRPSDVRRAIYIDGEDLAEQFDLLLEQLQDAVAATVAPQVTGRGEIMKVELFGHTVLWGVVRAVGRPFASGGVPDDGLIVETLASGRLVARWVSKAAIYGLRAATQAEANRGLQTFIGGNPERCALAAAIAVDLYAGEETPDDPLEGLSPTLVAAAQALYASAHEALRVGTLPGRWHDDLWGAWVELALPACRAEYKHPLPSGAQPPPFHELELHKALRALVDEMRATLESNSRWIPAR